LLIKKLKNKLLQVFPKSIPSKIAVAVSGGVDSISLLFLLLNLKKYSEFSQIEIFPITIDHKIRPNSYIECQEIHQYLLPNFPNHQILTAKYQKPPQVNIENIARNQRYELLANFCHENQIKCLFLGHHQQDVAENFLIRLFRGSGIDGLAAMKEVFDFKNIKLIRPLLDCKKADLENYIKENSLKYFHDFTNDEDCYLRNKIRFFIDDFSQKDLINQRIVSAAQNIYESKAIIEEDMLAEVDKFTKFSIYGYAQIDSKKILKIPQQKFWRYLAWILIEIGGGEYKPRLEKLRNLSNKIANQKDFKSTLHGCVVEGKKDQILFYREKSKIKNLTINQNSGRTIWDNRYVIEYNNKITDLCICDISATQLNKFIKNQNISKKNIQKFLKKEIIQTFLVIYQNQKIISLPFLNWIDENYKNQINLNISFNFRTPLGKSYENTPL
jgi:tRNA(Ile)-lysidine synthase